MPGTVSKTLFARNGAKILNNLPPLMDHVVEVRSNFLKKRMGSGGSPSKNSISKLSSAQASNRNNNLTTVRVRQRDNSYMYKNGSMMMSGG